MYFYKISKLNIRKSLPIFMSLPEKTNLLFNFCKYISYLNKFYDKFRSDLSPFAKNFTFIIFKILTR